MLGGGFVNKLFNIGNIALLSVLVFLCVYPFYFIFINSVSMPGEIIYGGIYFVPKGFTLTNYTQLFAEENILHAFIVSFGRTVIGTAITVFFCALFAYVMTRPELRFRKFIYRLTVATMYLNPGIIPWYVTMKMLGLQNNFLLYVLPGAIVAFLIILVKVFIEQLPESLEESAMIEGAGLHTIFLQIIVPLTTPVLAVCAIFNAVNQWNAWQDNFFLADTDRLRTLQLMLLNYVRNQTVHITLENINNLKASDIVVNPKSIKMTITMIVTLPVIFVYPIFQRFFVKGIMLGAVKG